MDDIVKILTEKAQITMDLDKVISDNGYNYDSTAKNYCKYIDNPDNDIMNAAHRIELYNNGSLIMWSYSTQNAALDGYNTKEIKVTPEELQFLISILVR